MASPDDDLVYLQPDFEPSSYTVANLRKVLFTHDIKYPSSAKKAELVAIFNSDLKPQARKILAKHRRIQRSSRGIEDAASSIASTQEDDFEEEAVVSPVKRARGRPKKSALEEPEEGTITAPPTTSRRRTPAPSKSKIKEESRERSKSRARAPRRTTTATPAPKQEEEFVPETWKKYGDDSPFSAENPFQSGSSPPPPTISSNRRRTEGAQSTKPRKTESRRKTDGPAVVRNAVVEMPVGRTSNVPDYEDDGIEAGEDFIPEEQTALEKARREGTAAIIPVRRRRQQPGTPPLVQFLLTFGAVAVISTGALWTNEKFTVGYCGVGRDSDKLGGVQIPEWADSLRPRCEPCPAHAICYDQLKTECERDFVLRQHPLALNGVLPLPPTCEPDSEKAKKIKAVSDFVTDELRKQKADAECGDANSPKLTEDDLKAKVEAKVKKGLTQEEVDALFAQAIDDVASRDEVTTTLEDSAVRSFSSSSLARISLSCAIRRSFRRTLERYIKQLVMIVLVLGAVTYPYWQYKKNVEIKRAAKQYAAAVYQNLQDDAAMLAYDPMSTRDGFLSVTQLRDDVLREEFSSSRRKAVWRHVEILVEQNSNIRTKVGALDTGDVGRAWKWIGAVRSIEDSAERPSAGSRRGSSRYSMPQPISSSSPMAELGKGANGDVVPREHFRRWDSGSRPAF